MFLKSAFKVFDYVALEPRLAIYYRWLSLDVLALNTQWWSLRTGWDMQHNRRANNPGNHYII